MKAWLIKWTSLDKREIVMSTEILNKISTVL